MRGISRISGPLYPQIGQPATYEVTGLYKDTVTNGSNIKWIAFKEEDGEWIELKGTPKTGKKATYTFTQKTYGKKVLIEAYLYSPEKKAPPGLVVKPSFGPKKIIKVEIKDAKGNTLTQKPKYGQSITAVVSTENMLGETLKLSLWEQDTFFDSGHDPDSNQLLWSGIAKVSDSKGIVKRAITLTPAIRAKANKSTMEGDEHEYYLLVEANNKTSQSGFVNVLDQQAATGAGTKSREIVLSPNAPKKAPAPAPKKQAKPEPGFWEKATLYVKNLLDYDIMPKSGTAPATVKQTPKIKFEKVKELAEEAVIHITSEIQTEIKTDKTGKVLSYPDYGGYNGHDEFKKDDKLYCKKVTVNGAVKSAFPTFKGYIYRGNAVGEAVKKLKQDLENKTHENAEPTVLELARHVQSNNKNFNTGGPTPPNTITSLYELKYQYGVSKKRESYRYRIVDNRAKNTGNFPSVELTKEKTNGTMSIGKRGSISIDPWKSSGLLGCVGVRGEGGVSHPSCASRMGDSQDEVKYKYIYHALNNYLESVIPELTGIYGRRGYVSSGEVAVAATKYDHQTKVFVLVDTLPELSLFNEEDARKALKIIHDKYGKDIATIVEKMYRMETSHFTSQQYQYCGTGGMEAFGDPPYYGWDSTTYKNHPEHTPIGTWSAYEGPGLSAQGGNAQIKNKPKTFVKLPTVLAGMEYKAEYIQRHDGNYARWYNTDPDAQEKYRESLKGVRARIVEKF